MLVTSGTMQVVLYVLERKMYQIVPKIVKRIDDYPAKLRWSTRVSSTSTGGRKTEQRILKSAIKSESDGAETGKSVPLFGFSVLFCSNERLMIRVFIPFVLPAPRRDE